MKEKHWILSVNRKEDHGRIDLLVKRGKLIKMTTIAGRPVCWEYTLEGEYDKETKEPVLITAWIGTGK